MSDRPNKADQAEVSTAEVADKDLKEMSFKELISSMSPSTAEIDQILVAAELMCQMREVQVITARNLNEATRAVGNLLEDCNRIFREYGVEAIDPDGEDQKTLQGIKGWLDELISGDYRLR